MDEKYFDKGILGTGNEEYLPVQKSSTNGGAYCILELGMAALGEDIQVELKAKGYKDVTWTITRTESGNYFGPDKYTIESIETVK